MSKCKENEDNMKVIHLNSYISIYIKQFYTVFLLFKMNLPLLEFFFKKNQIN